MGLILLIVGVAAVITGVFFIANNSGKGELSNTLSNTNQGENHMDKTGKTIVVYYSAQNHTKNVATKIAENLSADIFEIVPEQVYTDEDLDWTNQDSRVSREHDNVSLRNIAIKSTDVPNWDAYDTVLLGYPIWWGIAAWPTDTFVKGVDFGDKTVIPFCTSQSSGVGESATLLKDEAKGGNWQSGYRFSQNATDSEIKTWTDNL